MKVLIVIYTVLFIAPLSLILWLPSDGWLMVVKIFLALWMIILFIHSSYSFAGITLGAFLCYLALLYALWWFFRSSFIGNIFIVAFVIWFLLKFKQIDDIAKEVYEKIDKKR